MAKAAFQAALLLAAGEENEVLPLSFTNALVIRSPWLWVAVFEERATKTGHLRTQDGTAGTLTVAFREAVTRLFSSSEPGDPLQPLVHGQQAHVERLIADFVAFGLLYGRVPLDVAGMTPAQAAQEFVEVLRPSVVRAERTLRELNAGFIEEKGGSSERFLLARHLDPKMFSRDDREALKKATVRSETYSFGNRNHPEHVGPRKGAPYQKHKYRTGDPCSFCHQKFQGTFSDHRKFGKCKANPSVV